MGLGAGPGFYRRILLVYVRTAQRSFDLKRIGCPERLAGWRRERRNSACLRQLPTTWHTTYHEVVKTTTVYGLRFWIQWFQAWNKVNSPPTVEHDGR